MKRILLLVIITCMICGCEDFLDTENLVKKDSSNFPSTVEDAQSALTGAYAMLRQIPDGDVGQSMFIASEILSDDRLGGGGPDDRRAQALNQLKKTDENMFSGVWGVSYAGIFRCNQLLSTLDNVKGWDNEAQKKQIKAELHFLRAYYYFDLCRMYGQVPLIVEPKPVNNPVAKPEELYALIASDLKTAIENFPSTRFQEISKERLGHATKWAAEGLLARVYLFYTGYYQKESLPLTEGELTKSQVIAYVEDCVQNSGHDLLGDFRNLWPYANSETKKEYKYAIDNNLSWIGEDGNNLETVFAIKFSSTASWSNVDYRNPYNLFMSIREQDTEQIFPYGIGWGFAPVATTFWNNWSTQEPNDIRREASILDVTNANEGLKGYEYGADKQMEETGYWQKKYVAINARDAAGNLAGYSTVLFNAVNDYMLNNTQDLVILRFADILLMLSELKGDAAPLNRVRQRVGLTPIAYSEQALRNERRWEMAFEGTRYYDLLRWHIAGEALATQNNMQVKNNSVDVQLNVGNIAERINATGGFMQIPKVEIDLSDGVLQQNEGWKVNDIIY